MNKDKLLIRDFAFFWVGDSIRVPDLLVKSIRKVYKDDANIYFLTNIETPNIEGVDKTIRLRLPKEMMTARLKAYQSIKVVNKHVAFLDADSICLGRMYIDLSSKDISVILRKKENKLINHNFRGIFYPEFIQKKFDDVMPYLFGLIIKKNQHSFFNDLYIKLRTLEKRFHLWYGDQYVLKDFVEQDKKNFSYIEPDTLMKVLSISIDDKDINISKIIWDIKQTQTPFITFKGKRIKDFMDEILEEL